MSVGATALLSTFRRAVEQLSPADFQYLGVAFVSCASGGVIEWFALNRDSSPGTGRPDGRIRLDSGRYIDVEVSAKAGWKAKIKKDLEACNPASVSHTEEIVFVTRHAFDPRKADHTSDDEKELLTYADGLLGASRPPIRFVHLDALVTELMHAKFKFLRDTIFKAEPPPTPFTFVRRYLKRRSLIDERDTWIPPLEAFDQPSVAVVGATPRLRIPKALREAVRAILETEREVVLTGRGACGKTTAALLLGREIESRFGMALYLDLAQQSLDVDAIADALARYATDGTLVIFDNVQALEHQELASLRAEIKARHEDEQICSVKVLYLSRHELPIIELPRVDMTVESAALEAVFDYFAERHLAQTGEALTDRARKVWCAKPERFGYDLIAFSIALSSNSHRLELGPGDWDDVYQYIWTVCFAPYSTELQHFLARLAAISHLGVFATLRMLGCPSPDIFSTPGQHCPDLLKRGIVVRQETSSERFIVYHSSFALLLWGAYTQNRPGSLTSELHTAIDLAPEAVSTIIRGLINRQTEIDLLLTHDKSIDRRGYQDILATLRSSLASDADRLATALLSLQGSLWRWLVEIVHGPGEVREPTAVPAIRTALSPLYTAARLTWLHTGSLSDLVPLLRWLRDDPAAKILHEMTASNDFIVHLAFNPGVSIAGFLKYLETSNSADIRNFVNVVHTAMDGDFFAERVLNRRLGGVFALLDYLEAHEDDAVCARVRSRLISRLAVLNLAKKSDNATSVLTNSVKLLSRFAGRSDEGSRAITQQVLRMLNTSLPAALLQPSARVAMQQLAILEVHAPTVAERLLRQFATDIASRLVTFDAKTIRTILTCLTPRKAHDADSAAIVAALHGYVENVDFCRDPQISLAEAVERFLLLDDIAPFAAVRGREELSRRAPTSFPGRLSLREAVISLNYFAGQRDSASALLVSIVRIQIEALNPFAETWVSLTHLTQTLHALDRHVPSVAARIRAEVSGSDLTRLTRNTSLTYIGSALRYFDDRAAFDAGSAAAAKLIRGQMESLFADDVGLQNMATKVQRLRLLDDAAPAAAAKLRSEILDQDVADIVSTTSLTDLGAALRYFAERTSIDEDCATIYAKIRSQLESTSWDNFAWRNLSDVTQQLRLFEDVAPSVAARIRNSLASINITALAAATSYAQFVDVLNYLVDRPADDGDSISITHRVLAATDALPLTVSATREPISVLIELAIAAFKLSTIAIQTEVDKRAPSAVASPYHSLHNRLWGEILSAGGYLTMPLHLFSLVRSVRELLTNTAACLPACLVTVRLANSLTVDVLATGLVAERDADLIGILNVVATQQADLCRLEVDLLQRLRGALHVSNVGISLLARINHAMESREDVGQTALILAKLIGQIDPVLHDDMLKRWIDEGGAQRIEANTQTTSPLDAARWTIGFVETHLPDLLASTISRVFADPHSVAVRALQAGLIPTTGLLFVCKQHPALGPRELLERLAASIDPGTWFNVPAMYSVRFLLSALYVSDDATVLKAFDFHHLVKVARYLFHHWRERTNRLESLGDALGLVGMTALLPSHQPFKISRERPAIAELDSFFTSQAADSRRLTAILGAEALDMRVSAPVATATAFRLSTLLPSTNNPRIEVLRNRAKSWLMACGARIS